MRYISSFMTILLSSHALSAEITLCRTVKPIDIHWWSWREVDGKRCWYQGPRNKPKSELRWNEISPPTLIPVVEHPEVEVKPPYLGVSYLVPFRAGYDTVGWWIDATPIKEWRVLDKRSKHD